MLRGDPVCRKEDCSQYDDIGLVFKEIISSSDQDKLKFIENVWKPGDLELFDQENPTTIFEKNCSYNVVATIRMFLRQYSLIFYVPGKKIAALHCQQARVSGNKTPSQPSCETAFNEPAYFKMRNDTYCQPAHNVCQRAVAYVMSQPSRFQHQ